MAVADEPDGIDAEGEGDADGVADEQSQEELLSLAVERAAADLEDEVFPDVPVRQWVPSLPTRPASGWPGMAASSNRRPPMCSGRTNPSWRR